MEKELREQFAELEHRQWAHWYKYMRDNMDDDNLERWDRQADTPYSELTEKEKDSDRKWADQVLQVIDKHLNEGNVIGKADN